MAAPMKGSKVGLQPRPSCPTQFAQVKGTVWSLGSLHSVVHAARIEVNLQRSTTRHRGRVDPQVFGESVDKSFDYVRAQHAPR